MKRSIYYLLLLQAFFCAVSILYFNGTGDSGDSITHYLFARYAPVHPSLYFDHWAKPVFVLLASPFAQFGFAGMKIFNSLISLAVIFFTYKTAETLKIRNSGVVGLLLMFSPLNYILTFSGLTEPLFALFTILGIYFCTKEKYLTASVLISFLPYIRSEGLIILGAFVLYFLYKKRWQNLAYLFSGSIAYGIGGYVVHGSFLWVFTKIPYAKLSSVYGHGSILHFVEELINVTGIPIYGLFWIGLASLVILLFRKKFLPEQHILLFLGFCAFFIAHSLFWYLGIFSSMGLKRVLIGVMPLIALIALQGFNSVVEANFISPLIKKVLSILLIAYIVIFPFTSNPSAINWEKDMMLSPDQKLAQKASEVVLEKRSTKGRVFYNHNYLSLTLAIDYFDSKQRQQISEENIQLMKSGDFLIWDNLYAGFESGLPKEWFDKNSEFTTLGIYSSNEQGKDFIFSVYQKQ